LVDNTKFSGDELWQHLFSPKNVAMVGASDVPGSWGFNIMRTLIHNKNRKIYPVNPSHPTVMGMNTYKSILDIPDEVDLAIIAVPAARVPQIMRECVQRSLKAAAVISGGFSETGEEGKRLEKEVVSIARGGGLRFIGPNTMGHANNHANFSILGFTGKVFTGPVSFAAQSGNMGSRIMQLGNSQGVGFSKFVCTGNEATIRLEDYLEFFAHNDDTKVICFYIEGLREARRFLKLAKETTIRKPIVVMKSGSTKGAQMAARSHTGALAGSDAVYSAAFKQAGVIRAETEEEVADVLTGLVKQPLPKGNRVAILTMGGGYGVVTAEACEKEGLQLATLSQTTLAKLDSMLPARWSHGNPVDLAGMDTMGDSTLMACLEAMLEDEGVDALISLIGLARSGQMMPPGLRAPDKNVTEAREKRLDQMTDRARQLGKPVLSVGHIPTLMPEKQSEDRYNDDIALYSGPQRTAKVLKHMLWYRRYLDEMGGMKD
jgi:acyl-CoA synthetase (NDP forming)